MSKNIFKILKPTLTLITVIIFTGCTSMATPKPNIDVTNESKWWKSFKDETLNQLEEQALRDNNSLLAKLYAYEKAKLNVDLSQNALLPNFSASLNGDASRAIDKSDTTTKSFGSSLSISYKVDLFGKLKNAKNAKELEASATVQDYLSARLILSAELARQYYQIAYINESIALTKQNIQHQAKIFDMTKVRYTAGAISKLDLLSSEQSLIKLQTSLDSLEFQKQTAMTSLSILLGIEPNGIFKDLPTHLDTSKIPYIADIRAESLSYRPDMMANELRLKEALVGVDTAKSNFYPSFSLTSSLGTSSNELLNILHNPVGSIGLNILLPFINYNENAINYKISKADYEIAKANFRTSLFNAMKEINDALNANEVYVLKDKKLSRSFESSKEIQNLSSIRYKAGAISMIDFIQIAQNTINAQQSFVDNKYDMLTARIDLFEATGGK
ncbi:putative Outer membrane efflux protein [Sulfurovum sp. enrichment culture clone C5]|uniref:Putative Outer membrane efflux protein n=1 Tax=Sulfurovum sp. enrichment culture clone C5 TaxID=497650 RepID=A0A0S4XRE0_9BACT|nr:putative Outer membrane efflux protein [Sulfurovum sp. enrichment culture clone C5]